MGRLFWAVSPNTHSLISCFFIEKGVPNRLAAAKNRTSQVAQTSVPTPEEAVSQFEREGGNLTLFSPFGADPLADSPVLFRRRHAEFISRFPSFDHIFHSVVNGNNALFRDGLKYFLELTERYSS